MDKGSAAGNHRPRRNAFAFCRCRTATLTERVLRRILDENDSAQINSLLIVTFTKAAAAELSARIGAALTSEIAAHPENKALKRQLALLPLAKISTISLF